MACEVADICQYSLRPAGEAEADIIKQLVRNARLNPLGLDWRRFTVAVDPAGQIIGCIQTKPHRQAQELASLVVRREWGGEGVARRLVEHIMDEAGRPVWLMCASPLVPFYERFDFETVEEPGEMPPYFRRIHRLFTLFRFFSRGEVRLAVMVWR